MPYLNDNHLATFKVKPSDGIRGNWQERQDIMYKLKNMFTQAGLKNGVDYDFCPTYDHAEIGVWFRDASNTSFFAIKYCDEK